MSTNITTIYALPTVARITLSGPADDVAAVPTMAGLITVAEAATRTGRTPWEVREAIRLGQLDAVAFNGVTHVHESRARLHPDLTAALSTPGVTVGGVTA